jgi:hypothetical protein
MAPQKQSSRLDQQESHCSFGRHQHDAHIHTLLCWHTTFPNPAEPYRYCPNGDLSSVYILGLYHKCSRHMLGELDLSLPNHTQDSPAITVTNGIGNVPIGSTRSWRILSPNPKIQGESLTQLPCKRSIAKHLHYL